MMKIAYIGIDLLYPALSALLDCGCQVMEIFTCETDNKTEFNLQVTAAARRLGAPCHMERITLADLRRLQAAGCQAVFCAGYYHRIPVLEGLPMVNVHPAHLPVGRGAWPMPVALLQGHRSGGVTLHKIVDELDAGDILLKEEFLLDEREDLETMTRKIGQVTRRLIGTLMKDFSAIYAAAIPQGPGEYWPCPTEEDWIVTPAMPPEQIDRVLRAFYGYECIWQDGAFRLELIGGRLTEQPPESGPCLAPGGTIHHSPEYEGVVKECITLRKMQRYSSATHRPSTGCGSAAGIGCPPMGFSPCFCGRAP